MEEPSSTTKGSLMPRYPWMLSDTINFSEIQSRVDAMAMLGVPYPEAVQGKAEPMARSQAKEIATEIATQGGPAGLEDKQIVALIAYLQRLGTDIKGGGASASLAPDNSLAAQKGGAP